MERLRPSAGPETAWYWERLHKKRRMQRGAGIAILGFGLVILLIDFLQIPAYGLPTVLSLAIVFLLPVLQGLSLLLASRGPVTAEAVERLRRQERMQLFRQAQGLKLPWQYRLWALVFEFLLGLLFLLATGQIVLKVLSTKSLSALGIVAWSPVGIFFLLGLLLVVDSTYIKPRRTRRLVERSSAELSYRLSLGELVTGDQRNQGNEQGSDVSL